MELRRATRLVGILAAAATATALLGAAAAPADTGHPHGAAHITGQVSASGTSVVGQHLAAAAYITPTDDAWDRLIATGSRLGFVVVNVASGPGTASDPDFASVIDRAHAAGITVLGYVDTGYLGGSDPVRRTRAGDTDPTDWMAQAEQDVNKWYGFYGDAIDGIFFDDVMNTCGPTSGSDTYSTDYGFLSGLVHAGHRGSLTVLNPGISVPKCYEDAGDVLLTYEGSAADYLNRPAELAPLPWQAKADPDKFWNIVYDTNASQLTTVMDRSKKDNVGYLYVTDDTLPNPYDTIPDASYWSAEADAAGSTAGAAPKPVRVAVAVGTSPTSVTVGWMRSRSRSIAGYDVYAGDRRLATVGRDGGRHGLFHATVSGLNPGTRYSFTVRARGLSSQASAASRVVHARTWPAWGPRPSAPSSPTITEVAAGSIRLGWGASRALGGITGYEVFQNDVRVLTLPASVTSVRVGGLALGSHVSFTVRASGNNGRVSAFSDPVSADIPNPAPITEASVDYGAETTTFQARFNVGFSFQHVFIDTDAAASTGYAFGGVGAEYMIENGTLYKDADDSNTWNWQPVSLDDGPLISTTGGLSVWQVPSSLFGPGTTMRVVFDGSGSYPEDTLAPITATMEG